MNDSVVFGIDYKEGLFGGYALIETTQNEIILAVKTPITFVDGWTTERLYCVIKKAY